MESCERTLGSLKEKGGKEEGKEGGRERKREAGWSKILSSFVRHQALTGPGLLQPHKVKQFLGGKGVHLDPRGWWEELQREHPGLPLWFSSLEMWNILWTLVCPWSGERDCWKDMEFGTGGPVGAVCRGQCPVQRPGYRKTS